MTTRHGTGILLDGKGVLITGPSGSGKSDLALRLMAQGAALIGDDYVKIAKDARGRIVMSAPDRIAGRIEVRNVGILEVPYQATAPVDLVLRLVDAAAWARLARLPDKSFITLEGVRLPCLDFYPFEVSGPEKLRAALKLAI